MSAPRENFASYFRHAGVLRDWTNKAVNFPTGGGSSIYDALVPKAVYMSSSTVRCLEQHSQLDIPYTISEA